MKNSGVPQNGLIKIPYWRRYSVPYTALQTAALTNSATIFTLPSKGAIHGAFANVSIAFAGTAIVTLGITIGDAGSNSRYMASFTVLSTGLLTPAAGIWIPSVSSTTDIVVYATVVGANLSALSQGVMDVYVQWAALP